MPVIPILFHHGKSKPVLKIFDKLKKLPTELRRYLPIFDVELIDTTSLTNNDILTIFKTANIKFSMFVMKYIQESPERVFQELRKLKDLVKILTQDKEGEELIYSTTIYFSKIPNTNMETIVNNFTEIEKAAGEIAKSGYEKAIEKGIERGIEKNVIKMLKLNYDPIIIQDITGLSLKRINKLKENL